MKIKKQNIFFSVNNPCKRLKSVLNTVKTTILFMGL